MAHRRDQPLPARLGRLPGHEHPRRRGRPRDAARSHDRVGAMASASRGALPARRRIPRRSRGHRLVARGAPDLRPRAGKARRAGCMGCGGRADRPAGALRRPPARDPLGGRAGLRPEAERRRDRPDLRRRSAGGASDRAGPAAGRAAPLPRRARAPPRRFDAPVRRGYTGGGARSGRAGHLARARVLPRRGLPRRRPGIRVRRARGLGAGRGAAPLEALARRLRPPRRQAVRGRGLLPAAARRCDGALRRGVGLRVAHERPRAVGLEPPLARRAAAHRGRRRDRLHLGG
jgi:hypothetical protein